MRHTLRTSHNIPAPFLSLLECARPRAQKLLRCFSWNRMRSALTPALSPRRGRNFRRVDCNPLRFATSKDRVQPTEGVERATCPSTAQSTSFALPLLGERAGVRADFTPIVPQEKILHRNQRRTTQELANARGTRIYSELSERRAADIFDSTVGRIHLSNEVISIPRSSRGNEAHFLTGTMWLVSGWNGPLARSVGLPARQSCARRVHWMVNDHRAFNSAASCRRERPSWPFPPDQLHRSGPDGSEPPHVGCYSFERGSEDQPT